MANQKSKKPQPNGPAGHNRKHPGSGSYFLSLEIKNVRCFSSKQVLDLSDGQGRPARWTILLGENGTGKTTLLQCLALHGRRFELMNKSAPFRDNEELKFFYYGLFSGISREPGNPRAQITYKALDGLNLTGTFKGIGAHEWDFDDLYRERHFQKTLRSDWRTPLAMRACFAYGAGRRSRVSSLNWEKHERATIFFEDTALLNAEEWLLQMDYSASKRSKIQGKQKELLGLVIQVLVKVLPEVEEIRLTQPTAEKPTPGVQFKTPYGWVALSQLGYGYRTMVAWIVDLASRMVERYPESPDPLAEPAVVLVDDIDLHLHPKWQRDLIGFLTDRFPNTQFIATAHSPLIVQAATGANIALLKREGDHVVIENNPETIRGWRIDQILTSDLFGLETARPPELEIPLLRRRELLTKPRLTKAEKQELKDIEARLGPLPAGESFEQAKTMALLEQSLEMLKKNQSAKP